jgi:predicted enzyme related to lactoylglutathione lyase
MTQEAAGHSAEHAPKHGDFCWTEIASTDASKCKAFYSTVFGWTFKDSQATDEAFAYHEFTTAGADYPSGGLYQISPEICGEGELRPPHLLTYVAVDDVDANARLAVELGGTVVKPPTDIPQTGRFAIIQDPTGAMLAIFKMMAEGGHHG